MRDLLLQAVLYGSLPITLVRPFVGLLMYSWLAYMRPQHMSWQLRHENLSLLVAVALFAGLALAWRRERFVTWRPQTVLLVGILAVVALSAHTGVPLGEGLAARSLNFFWKAVLIALVTTGLVRTQARLRAMFLVIGFSLGGIAVKWGIYSILRGGVRFHLGPGGFMSDNNTFALALNMALPLLVGIALTERQRWIKMAAVVSATFVGLTILLTFSRNGVATLAIVVMLLVWRAGRPLMAALMLVLGISGFLLFSSPEFKRAYVDRVVSVVDYEEDSSALGRLRAWRTSWRIFLDYPLLGVGPDNLPVVHRTYSENPDRFLVTHNSFLHLLAECGLLGAGVWVLILAVTFVRLRRLRHASDDPWVVVFSRMLQFSLLAYIVGTQLLSMPFFDLLYHLIGLSVCLEVVAADAAQSGAVADKTQPQGEPWWRTSRRAAVLARTSET